MDEAECLGRLSHNREEETSPVHNMETSHVPSCERDLPSSKGRLEKGSVIELKLGQLSRLATSKRIGTCSHSYAEGVGKSELLDLFNKKKWPTVWGKVCRAVKG